MSGASFNMVLVCAGCLLVYFQNIENDIRWIGKYASKTGALSVVLQEPLVVKLNSYKVLAKVESVLVNGEWITVKGDILIYFKKDSIPPDLSYGSQIIIQKPLQRYAIPGNPGAFDYKQYCAGREFITRYIFNQKIFSLPVKQIKIH
jgi:competence protein ComEC